MSILQETKNNTVNIDTDKQLHNVNVVFKKPKFIKSMFFTLEFITFLLLFSFSLNGIKYITNLFFK